MVLEGAYVTNQRNNLENVADELDSLLLFNIDRMVFFRNGMQSALDLAESGYYVYLVEESPAIGGAMAQLDKTFPTNDCSM